MAIRRQIIAGLTGFSLFFSLSAPVGAQALSGNGMASQSVRLVKEGKLSASLAQAAAIATGKNTSPQHVLIYFKQQADTENAAQQAGVDQVARRKAVIGSLRETALRSQAAVRAILQEQAKRGTVTQIESFYIINALGATVSPELASQIAARPEVQRVENVKQITNEEPIKQKRRSRRSVQEESTDGIEWGIHATGAPRVWQELHIDGAGVTVGVIDSGTYYEHPALQKHFKGYNSATGKTDATYYRDFVEQSNTKPRTEAAFDHGTHVTGTIVGQDGAQNRIGMAPGAKFVAARAIGPKSGDETQILKAAQWIMNPGQKAEDAPRVVNNSWGGDNDDSPWFAKILKTWRDAGIVPVFAAGNASGYPADASIANPANLPGAFAVGATDSQHQLGDFSQVGPSAAATGQVKPEVSAPGVRVRSAVATGGYAALSGTSMAAPHVTGTIALMFQANPNLTVAQVESILEKTATPRTDKRYSTSPNMGYGYGEINAYEAVRAAQALAQGKTDDQRFTVTGQVLTAGQTTQSPVTITPQLPDVAYRGRDVTLRARIQHSVSVDQVIFTTVVGNKTTKTPAKLVDGTVSDGSYEVVIPAAHLTAEDLKVQISALGWANPEPTLSDVLTIEIRSGVTPGQYQTDFTNGAPGWLFTGDADGRAASSDWAVGIPSDPAEPAPLDGKLLGTKPGFKEPTAQLDSYAEAPPIDVSQLGTTPALSFDEYLGFNGVCMALVQVSSDDGKTWEKLDQKLIKPGSTPKWQNATYSLAPWVGKTAALRVRFYFRYPLHGQGPGWYIDNFAVTAGDQTPPPAVTHLQAQSRTPGVEISWQGHPVSDLDAYYVYRADGYQERTKIGQIPADAAQTVYVDKTARVGTSYAYSVRAVDTSGNESAIGQEAIIKFSHNAQKSWDFNQDAQWQTRALSGTVNDWQWGVPCRVANNDSPLALRNAQNGLEPKITSQDKVWGTNLGSAAPNSPAGSPCIANVSKGNNAYVQSPVFTVGADGEQIVEFESFNTLHYLGEYQKNLETVQVVQGGTATTVIGAKDLMDENLKWQWHWFQASLAPWAGKQIALRFLFQTGANTHIDREELGWYVDNIKVGKPGSKARIQSITVAPVIAGSADPDGTEENDAFPFAQRPSVKTQSGTAQRVNKPTAQPASGHKPQALPSGVVPVANARVEVVQTHNSQPVRPQDGSFKFLLSPGQWQLRASAYGYLPQTKTINGPDQVRFVLTPAPARTLHGRVVGANGQTVAGAWVRVVEDSNIAPVSVSADGSFTISGVPGDGTYTVRAFAPSFEAANITVDTKTGDPTAVTLTLKPLAGTAAELHYDSGQAATHLQLLKAGRGAAVRFTPKRQNTHVTGAKIYFVPDRATHKDVSVLVLSEDQDGRLRTLANIPNYQAQPEWNTIDLSGYSIKVNRDFYVAVVQNHAGNESVGVGIDNQGLEAVTKTDRSFLYNGAFVPAASGNVAGAFMIRAMIKDPGTGAPLPDAPGKEPSEEETPNDPTAAANFDWEIQNDHAVLKKYHKNKDVQNTEVVVPSTYQGKPVTTIGENAFSWARRSRITLPSTVTTIKANAFNFALTKDGVLQVPRSVTKLEAGSLSGLHGVQIKGMAGIKHLAAGSCKDTFGAHIELPQVQSIDPAAFGGTKRDSFAYNHVITTNRALPSAEGLYLVNPVKVKTQVLMVDTDRVDYDYDFIGPGDNTENYSITKPLKAFYLLGQTVTVTPPVRQTVSYLDGPQTLQLDKPLTTVTFRALPLKATLREPIFASTDREIVGIALPGSAVKLSVAATTRNTKTNPEGIFRVSLPAPLSAGQSIKVEITDQNGKSYESTHRVSENTQAGQQFIVAPSSAGILQRYLGTGGEVVLPASVTDMRGQERNIAQIAPLVFQQAGLTKVSGLEHNQNLEQIGAGAFSQNQLTALKLPTSLRVIADAAFAHNRLSNLDIPKLTHRIGARAFANNQLTHLTLGQYTGHFGMESFADNQLTEVTIPASVEEIGVGAFARNQLRQLTFATKDPTVFARATQPVGAVKTTSGSSHAGLTEIAPRAFANNQLSAVRLPLSVTKVAPDSFANNGQLVNLVAAASGVEDSILTANSGHIVGGTEIQVSFVDENGKTLRASQTWVGQNLQRRVGADPAVFYRAGQTVTVQAPAISGYRAITATSQVTPVQGGATKVRFVYAKAGREDQGQADKGQSNNQKTDSELAQPGPSGKNTPGSANAQPGSGATGTVPSEKSEKEMSAASNQRLGGANRYQSALQTWQALTASGKPIETLLLATGREAADGLSATQLAKTLKAAVVLGPDRATEDAIMNAVHGGKIKRIVQVGGQFGLSKDAQAQARNRGVQYVTLVGKNRFETATKVATYGASLQRATKVYVADGKDFPDALTAGAAASQEAALLVLTQGDKLPTETRQFLARTRLPIWTVGGPATRAVKNAAMSPEQIIVGKNRYLTALGLFQRAAGSGKNGAEKRKTLVLVSGRDFPDAITGGAYSANVDGQLLLVPPASMGRSLLREAWQSHEQRVIIGGKRAVAQADLLASVS